MLVPRLCHPSPRTSKWYIQAQLYGFGFYEFKWSLTHSICWQYIWRGPEIWGPHVRSTFPLYLLPQRMKNTFMRSTHCPSSTSSVSRPLVCSSSFDVSPMTLIKATYIKNRPSYPPCPPLHQKSKKDTPFSTVLLSLASLGQLTPSPRPTQSRSVADLRPSQTCPTNAPPWHAIS